MKLRRKPAKQLRAVNRKVLSRPPAYHYSAKRSDSDKLLGRMSQEETNSQQDVRDRRAHSAITIIVSIVLCVAIMYSMVLSDKTAVRIDSSSQPIREVSEYQKKADELVGASLKNSFKQLFDEKALQEALYAQFPELQQVTVKTNPFSTKPQVHLVVGRPAAILSSGSSMFVIDQTGKAIADVNNPGNTPVDIDTGRLPVLQDQTGVNLSVGKPALTIDQLQYLYVMQQQSAAKNLDIDSMIMKNGGGELEVRFSGVPYTVKMNFFEDPRLSFGTFYAMKQKAENEKITIAEYIDVRIAERAYIK